MSTETGRDPETGRFVTGYSGNPTGAEPRFQTPEEMQEAVDAYFEKASTHVTMTGMALALGITLETFRTYKKRDGGYFEVVSTARQRVGEHLEYLLLYGGKPVGPIFNLKNNFGWKDALKVQHTGADDGPIQTITKEMTAEEAAEAYKELMGN